MVLGVGEGITDLSNNKKRLDEILLLGLEIYFWEHKNTLFPVGKVLLSSPMVFSLSLMILWVRFGAMKKLTIPVAISPAVFMVFWLDDGLSGSGLCIKGLKWFRELVKN